MTSVQVGSSTKFINNFRFLKLYFCGKGFNTGLGSFDWEWKSAAYQFGISETAPSRDHTLNADTG